MLVRTIMASLPMRAIPRCCTRLHKGVVTAASIGADEGESTFRTEVIVGRHSGELLSHNDPILLMGSCFSENIGEKLQHAKFDLVVNPFGISYHPLPLARSLDRLANPVPFTHSDLSIDLQDRFCSFEHHTRYSNADADLCLKQINADLERGAAQLLKAKFLFLTLGTAWGYSHSREDGKEEGGDRLPGPVVANCHQMPHRSFVKWMVRPDQAAAALRSATEACLRVNPSLQIVVTVSPVRHWRDGAIENSRAKASLLLAVDELVGSSSSSRVTYFPSYELVLDDLRDYRFFEQDMLHPSAAAIDYIFTKLKARYFDSDHDGKHDNGGQRNHKANKSATRTSGGGGLHGPAACAVKHFEALHRAVAHRTLGASGSDAHVKFCTVQLKKIADLEQTYPYVDLSTERNHFEAQLQQSQHGQ